LAKLDKSKFFEQHWERMNNVCKCGPLAVGIG